MRRFAVADFKKHLASALRTAQEEDVIVTKHGKPLVRVQGIRNQRRWKQMIAAMDGPAQPVEEVWEELGIPEPKRLRYEYPKGMRRDR